MSKLFYTFRIFFLFVLKIIVQFEETELFGGVFIMALGDRIRGLREKNNQTQKSLAEKLNIPHQNLSNYERGFRQPDYETLKKIADYFNVTLDYLITGEDGKAPSPDEFWKEILDPETQLFFKDLYEAPEESIKELKEIWEVIKKRREK
jgi:transcriptional regulator with XRE-family HTH domain